MRGSAEIEDEAARRLLLLARHRRPARRPLLGGRALLGAHVAGACVSAAGEAVFLAKGSLSVALFAVTSVPYASGYYGRRSVTAKPMHASVILPAPPARKAPRTTLAGGACRRHARRHAKLGGRRRRRVVQLAHAAAAHLARAIQHQPVGRERRQRLAHALQSERQICARQVCRRAPRGTIVAHASPGSDRKRRRAVPPRRRRGAPRSTAAATPSSRAVGAPRAGSASRRPSRMWLGRTPRRV